MSAVYSVCQCECEFLLLHLNAIPRVVPSDPVYLKRALFRIFRVCVINHFGRAPLYQPPCVAGCMGLLILVASIKLQVSFPKETYKTDDILQKRPII